jgi:hypothetical protein
MFVLTSDIVISRTLSHMSIISTKPCWSMVVIEFPHSSWNRWSQSEENFILIKLCGLILYMVLKKFLHSSLSLEFCDIVVKLVNYVVILLSSQWCFFTCEMMMLNFVIWCMWIMWISVNLDVGSNFCNFCHILTGSRMQPLMATKSWLVPRCSR